VGITLYSQYICLTISNSFDSNNENKGTSFKAQHPDWMKNLMMEDFA